MTLGVSPKVKNPTLLLVCVGLAIAVLGIVLPDGDLRTIGLTALGAGMTGFVAGYRSDPGEVTTTVGQASDEALSPEAAAAIADGPEVEPEVAA